MLYIIILLLLLPLAAQADVIINEICWMGAESSANDEWIELYSDKDTNLDGWALYEGETLIEPLAGTIKANSYYLIERTDDETVPNIPASQEPTGWTGHGLNNKGEDLRLLDNNSNLIDQVDCREGWLGGDSKTKQTMERSGSIWQTSQNPGGTPKAENSQGRKEEKQETETKEKPLAGNYPEGLVFNEILPSPEGPDSENEWIELFNENEFELDLSSWQVKDLEGRTTTYTFSIGTKISSKSYLVLSRTETKITLNNDNDGLNLIQPNGEIIDSVNYEKAAKDQSYNRTDSGWAWSIALTPGKANIISEKRSVSKSETKELTEAQPAQSASLKEKIPQPFQNLNKKQPLFLIAFILALFSGITVLILKKRLSD